MVAITAYAFKKYNKRKADKARADAVTNLEDTSRELVYSPTAEIIRPAQGGMVQYYSPEDAGQPRSESLSTSSSDSPSIRSSAPASACSHCRHCKNEKRKSSKSSSTKSSFSWKEGWHPVGRKVNGDQAWRGGWPGSEHVEGWRAHMTPVQSNTSTEQWQSWHELDAARNALAAESSTNVSACMGCGQVNPESPSSVYSSAGDHFLRDIEPPAYDATPRYEME